MQKEALREVSRSLILDRTVGLLFNKISMKEYLFFKVEKENAHKTLDFGPLL